MTDTKVISKFEYDYFFLSNFYLAPIKAQTNWGEKLFADTETYYQAMKATTLGDFNFVSESKHAGDAKKRGRSIKCRKDWEDIKGNVMKLALGYKFSQNKELGKRLLDTLDTYLVEGNHWHDNTWGVCSCTKCPGFGENRLGNALMEVREQLRAGWGDK